MLNCSVLLQTRLNPAQVSRTASREVSNIKAGKELARAESKFLRAVNE